MYDAYLKSQEKEGLYPNSEVQKLIRITRTLNLIIAACFLLNTYAGTVIAKNLEEYNQNLKIQLLNSWIAIIPAVLAVYIAFNGENEFVQTFNPEL